MQYERPHANLSGFCSDPDCLATRTLPGNSSTDTFLQLAFLGNAAGKGLRGWVCRLSRHHQKRGERTGTSRLCSTISRTVPGSAENSFKEEKEADDISKTTINARGEK